MSKRRHNLLDRRDLGTWVIVTVFTLLIWYWAAGETRIEQVLNVRVQLAVASSPNAWRIQPRQLSVAVTAQGSRRAIRNAEESSREITLQLPPRPGTATLDLATALRAHPAINQTGITVISTDPAGVEVERDEIITEQARVIPKLPNVKVDEIAVQPPQVDVSLPSQLRRQFADDLTVEAVLDRAELANLDPGVRHTLDNVRLRLPGAFTSPPDAVSFNPPVVSISLVISSQIAELTLDKPVRVQVLSPPEDQEIVEVEPKQIPNVTVSGPVDLIEQIRTGEAVVVAVLHLKSSERDRRIESKPITAFMALIGETGIEVEATVAGSPDPPVISLTITEAAAEQ